MIDGLPAPTVRLLYKGVDIWNAISSEVISLTFTDTIDGQADEIDIELRNNHQKWFDAWFPDLNDQMQGFLGYKGGKLLDMGTFFLDEPHASGSRSGDVFHIKGQSKPVNQALKTRKTRAFEGQSQKQIAHKVLSDAGLSLIGEPPDVAFARVTQRREMDVAFLARMASDYGCFFAVKGGAAVYANRDDLIAQSPVRTFRKGMREIVTYELRHASDKTHSKAKASYFDGNAKKTIEVEVEDKQVSTGDVLKTDDRVESHAHARKLASSKLQKANAKAWSGTFELFGDPACQAGQTVALEGFGRWNRKYLIMHARHRYARSGYTTNVELEDARKSA